MERLKSRLDEVAELVNRYLNRKQHRMQHGEKMRLKNMDEN